MLNGFLFYQLLVYWHLASMCLSLLGFFYTPSLRLCRVPWPTICLFIFLEKLLNTVIFQNITLFNILLGFLQHLCQLIPNVDTYRELLWCVNDFSTTLVLTNIFTWNTIIRCIDMIVNKYHTFTDILVNNASKLPFSDRTFNFDLFSVRVAYELFKQNTNTYTLSLFSLDDLIKSHLQR